MSLFRKILRWLRPKPSIWVCPQCGAVNVWASLFCQNYPGPSDPVWSDPAVFKCTGLHPEYWKLTKDWPVRKGKIRNDLYYK